MERPRDIYLWPYWRCNGATSVSGLLTLSPAAEHTKRLFSQINNQFFLSHQLIDDWLPQVKLRQRWWVFVLVYVRVRVCVLPGLNSGVWIHTLRLFYCCSCSFQEPKWSKTDIMMTSTDILLWMCSFSAEVLQLTSRIFLSFWEDFIETEAAMMAWSCWRTHEYSKSV